MPPKKSVKSLRKKRSSEKSAPASAKKRVAEEPIAPELIAKIAEWRRSVVDDVGSAIVTSEQFPDDVGSVDECYGDDGFLPGSWRVHEIIVLCQEARESLAAAYKNLKALQATLDDVSK